MEITPGEGYLLDDKIYVVQLDRDNLDIKKERYMMKLLREKLKYLKYMLVMKLVLW